MEDTDNLNQRDGRSQTAVIEKELITNEEELGLRTKPEETQEQEKAPSTEEKSPQKPKRKRRKGLILAGAGLGAVAAGIFGLHWWQFASTHQETDDATVSGNVHPISSRINGTITQVLVNDNQPVQQGQLLVKLDPRDYKVQVQQAEAALQAAQRQANAAQANISLSSQTTTGKTAQAQGNVKSALAGISTAQAAVKEAQAGIPVAEASVKQAQAGIPAAEAQVAQTQATVQQTQADYNRYQQLYTEGAISRQQLDAAKANYDVAVGKKDAAVQGVQQAKAQLAAAQQGVAQAQSKLAQAQEGVTNAEAQLAASQGSLQQATAGGQQTVANKSQYEAAVSAIAQAQASLKNAELQLSYTNIVAPTAGKVGNKQAQVGQRVQVGTPLMSIVDNDYWVTANFKETQLEHMKPGEEVEIKLDSFPHHTFKGVVNSIAPGSGAEFALLPPDNATGNFTKIVQRVPVKIVFDRQSIKGYESRIVPGMSAVVTVTVK